MGTFTSYGTFFSITTGYGFSTVTWYGFGTCTGYGLSTGTLEIKKKKKNQIDFKETLFEYAWDNLPSLHTGLS